MDRDSYTKFEERTPADEALEASRTSVAALAASALKESVPFIDHVRIATREGRLVIKAPAYYFQEAEAVGYVPVWINRVGDAVSFRTRGVVEGLCYRNIRNASRADIIDYIPRNATNEDVYNDKNTAARNLDPYAFPNADLHACSKPWFYLPFIPIDCLGLPCVILPQTVLDVLACGYNNDPASYVRNA